MAEGTPGRRRFAVSRRRVSKRPWRFRESSRGLPHWVRALVRDEGATGVSRVRPEGARSRRKRSTSAIRKTKRLKNLRARLRGDERRETPSPTIEAKNASFSTPIETHRDVGTCVEVRGSSRRIEASRVISAVRPQGLVGPVTLSLREPRDRSLTRRRGGRR